MSKKQQAAGYRPSIVTLGRGWLFRAQVYLPERMWEPGNFCSERVVFFESPGLDKNQADQHLMKLLQIAWCLEDGEVHPEMTYNILNAETVIADASGPESTGDLRLFESSFGWADGVDYVNYWRSGDIDFFVTPRVARRMHELLDQIESLYGEDKIQE